MPKCATTPQEMRTPHPVTHPGATIQTDIRESRATQQLRSGRLWAPYAGGDNVSRAGSSPIHDNHRPATSAALISTMGTKQTNDNGKRHKTHTAREGHISSLSCPPPPPPPPAASPVQPVVSLGSPAYYQLPCRPSKPTLSTPAEPVSVQTGPPALSDPPLRVCIPPFGTPVRPSIL